MRQTLEDVDKTLNDLTGIDSGKVIVMGGEFRQVIPIIPTAN